MTALTHDQSGFRGPDPAADGEIEPAMSDSPGGAIEIQHRTAISMVNFPLTLPALGRVIRHIALAGYFLALISPNLVIYALYPDRADAGKLVISCAIVALWHASFRRIRVAILCFLPVCLTLPFVLYFIYLYHDFPNTGVIDIVLQTNSQEALDYLRGHYSQIAPPVLAALGIWLAALFAIGRGAADRTGEPQARTG
jgi:hypothetical protein